jgi:hypothetical protein
MPLMKPVFLRDFANSRQLGARVVLTRASPTWCMNRFGLLQAVQSGAPEFSFDQATGASLGLGIWDQRTNSLLHNRDLTNATWVTTAGTGTETKDATGADGVANAATRITATSANYTLIQSITSASALRAATCYVRRITGTGTIEFTANAGLTWTPITVTSAFTRVAAPVATITNPEIGFRITSSGDEIAVDFVQCETGAFATPPIETAGSNVTRVADVVSITGAEFSGIWPATEGTVVAEGSTFNPTGFVPLWQVSDGTANNRIEARLANSGSAGSGLLLAVAGGVTSVSMAVQFNGAAGATNRLAAAYQTNNFGASRNGQAESADTSATVPAVTQLILGGWHGGGQTLNGYLSRFYIYPRRLSAADTPALSVQ